MRELIENLINVPFGFCAFSEVEDRLLPCRAQSRLPENAKTIIMFAFPYKVEEKPPLNISRYAAVPDYHEVCGEMLSSLAESLKESYPENKFEYFIDNSPIPEVYAAVSAGLGVRGKNGLLITKEYGSFVFLGEIVTDLYIEPQKSSGECLGCGICLERCPVGLDKSRCLSALTQKKGELSPEQQEKIKKSGCVWGCDICQECCPHNKDIEKTGITQFVSGYRNEYIKGEEISGRAYAWRGEKVILRNADLLGSGNRKENKAENK